MAETPTVQDDALVSLLESLHVSETFPIPQDSFPLLNPVDLFRCYIADRLAHLTGKDAKLIASALAWTNTLDKGDLVIAIPRLQIKGVAPGEKAAELAEKFPQNRLTKKPRVSGISLVFDFEPRVLPHIILPIIFGRGSKYGLSEHLGLKDVTRPEAGRKRMIVEFSSPNIAKEFHVGHLRSTIIGAFLSNLYEGLGWEVLRFNYLGDWGRQFGLLAIGWERYGDEKAFEEDPIAHLFEVYVKISADFKPEEDAYKAAGKRGEDTSVLETAGLLGAAKGYFKRMEDGDESALVLWRRFRQISIEKYKKSYARLRISFDEYSGESTVLAKTMDEVEKVLREKGLSEMDNGASIVDFRKFGAKKLEVAIIRNRNGTSNYLLRDLGAAIQRYRGWGMDHMIYVVMSEQDIHVARFFKILELMGDEYAILAGKLQHITFGKIKGMSTRRGTVKFLGDVLNDVGASMHNVMRQNEDKYKQVEDPEKVSDILGISSIMVQDMSGKRINAYDFDLDRMLSFEGDTGPYLQYAHARLCSIARRTGFSREQLAHSADFSLLQEPHSINLIRLMASWPDVILHTHRTLEPSTIVTYLFRLTHQLSSSYDVLKVIGAAEGEQVGMARAALYEAARQVLSNGMMMLGLTPVERM